MWDERDKPYTEALMANVRLFDTLTQLDEAQRRINELEKFLEAWRTTAIEEFNTQQNRIKELENSLQLTQEEASNMDLLLEQNKAQASETQTPITQNTSNNSGKTP
jgi:hypothetical protein